MSLRLTTCLLLLCCLLVSAQGRKVQALQKLGIDENTELRLSADNMDYSQDNKLARATGQVVVEYGQLRLTADKAEINQETLDFLAQGNVVLDIAGQGRWTAPAVKGNISSHEIITRSTLTERGCNIRSTSFEGDPRTVGVHTHGCGTPIESHNKLSIFNYEDCVKAKAKLYGYELEKADIYSGDFDDVVQNCVEDLIVDEEAMELAFEGTRFFDLMRVAHRRNDPSYLANRVARRDASLKSKLLDTRNWYFRLK